MAASLRSQGIPRRSHGCERPAMARKLPYHGCEPCSLGTELRSLGCTIPFLGCTRPFVCDLAGLDFANDEQCPPFNLNPLWNLDAENG